jgi:hypothetical protein
VTFSYTQVSQYLRCPRSYRYRYLDGWREKESRASLCFGRCFEKALAAFFHHEDAGSVLFKEWGAYQCETNAGWKREAAVAIAEGMALRWRVANTFAFSPPDRSSRLHGITPVSHR